MLSVSVDGSIEPGLARKRMMRDSNGRGKIHNMVCLPKGVSQRVSPKGWLPKGHL